MAFIHIDLGEFDTRDLIEELGERYLYESEQQELLDMIKAPVLESDMKKMKIFLSVMDKYSAWEIHDMLITNAPPKAGDNQLPLNI